MGAALLWLSALVCLLASGVGAARDAARGTQCRNNLKQIGLALRNYWDVPRCFPPASTYDKSGRPMHSWRLLIKPYLDCSATYARVNFSEPWNSPSNRKVLAEPQYIYKCPADQIACAPDSSTTSYLAVAGRRAPWRPGRNQGPDDPDLQRQMANSFLVVETTDSGIAWAEPKDIRFDDVQALRSLVAKSPHLRDNGYFFRKTPAVNAVLVEGDMIFMFPWDSSISALNGLVPPDEPPRPRSEPVHKEDPFSRLYVEKLRVHWPHAIGLPVWIAAFGLLFHQVRRHGRRIGP